MTLDPVAVAGRDAARDIRRGVTRLLCELDMPPVAEVRLISGRRADLMSVAADGEILIVEIKSCRSDFISDMKWTSYLDHCDRFFFAVDRHFPVDLLPAGEGLILADRWDAEIVREPQRRKLPPARRKSIHLRLARQAAARVAMLDHALIEEMAAERAAGGADGITSPPPAATPR